MAVTPEMISAVGYLISTLMIDGVKLSQLLAEAKKNEDVPPETWEAVRADVIAAGQAWDSAPGPPAPGG